MEDARAFNMTTSGPSPMTPRSETAAPNPPANTSGWQAERALGPQPGIDLIDRMVENATARERVAAQQPDAMQQMLQSSMVTQQLMAKLIDILANKLLAAEAPEPKPKVKEKKP
jgi:hypothetical protein